VSTETTSHEIDAKSIEIRPLEKGIDRAAFSCGSRMIDNFFRNNARQHHDQGRVRVYVAMHDNVPVGYYWLVASSKNPDDISEVARDKFGRVGYAPCVYLGMIGVDQQHQKLGIGRKLMVHAMKRALAVSEIVGVYALVLDAVDRDVAELYRRWSFEYFDADVVLEDGSIPMYIPISTLRAADESRKKATQEAAMNGAVQIADEGQHPSV
jgi:GNAT superfamily N-acetyltransferase